MPTNDRLGIRIGFLVHDLSRLRRAVFDSRNPHQTITRTESWVLTGVSRKRTGMSQTELARVLGLGKTATGEFVKSLELKGFVTRIPDPQDQRAYSVQLTRNGRVILAKIATVVTRMNAGIFKNFTSAELQQFADHLKKMKLELSLMAEAATAQKLNRKPAVKTRVAIQQRRRK